MCKKTLKVTEKCVKNSAKYLKKRLNNDLKKFVQKF